MTLQAHLVGLARQWLSDYADRAVELRTAAREAGAAIPAEERLDAVHPLPELPDRFTVVAADGSQIQPDRHGAALYYVINIGSLTYRHGSGKAPEAASHATLAYSEEDLYENGMPVAGNLLDVRRDLAELRRLADVCETESDRPVVALVDGPIVLWVLKDLPGGARQAKVTAYLEQLDRIRRSGGIVGGYISRPGYNEVNRLLHVAHVTSGETKGGDLPNVLERLADRAVFASLPGGARSALFVSSREINQEQYASRGHEVHFFYLNLAEDGQRPVIARMEIPAWVAGTQSSLDTIHAAVVAQGRITGDYPYALARADELAYMGSRERAALEDMMMSSLLRAGVRADQSPKAHYKRLTRRKY